jgi:hypothetical protein
MSKYICSILLVGFVLSASISAFGSAATPELDKERILKQQEKLYKQFSGKEPVLSNLIKSLDKKATDSKSAIEVIFAIDLLERNKINTQEVVDKLINCHKTYTKDITVRVQCAEYLLRIKKEKGIELSLSDLKDSTTGLEYKLMTGLNLVEIVGNLEGYIYIKDGFLSGSIVKERLSVSLLKALIPYNGKQISPKGPVVDIEDIIKSVENKVVNAETLEALKEVRLKLIK